MTAVSDTRKPAPPERARRRRRSAVWSVLTRPVFWAALPLVLALLCVLVPDLFTSRSPDAVDPAHSLAAPSASHWFGTDELGRDMYARIVHGARPSLEVGVFATLFALAVGTATGLAAGWFGSWADALLMRAVDVLLAFPALLLALAVVAVLGPGTGNVAVAVGIAGVPAFARVTRAEVLRVRSRAYVEAAVAAGVGRRGIVLRHVLPNTLAPVAVLASVMVGTAILAASSLSFLGFGPRPPTPEWGALVAGGRNYLPDAWWLTTFPGLAVAAVVLSVSAFDRALGGADPRSRATKEYS